MSNLIARLESLLESLNEWDHPITAQDDLRRAIDLLKWQPISNAPKDGTLILGCVKPKGVTWDARFEQWKAPVTVAWRGFHPNAPGKNKWREADGKPAHITHYRPLPAPPEGDGG